VPTTLSQAPTRRPTLACPGNSSLSTVVKIAECNASSVCGVGSELYESARNQGGSCRNSYYATPCSYRPCVTITVPSAVGIVTTTTSRDVAAGTQTQGEQSTITFFVNANAKLTLVASVTSLDGTGFGILWADDGTGDVTQAVNLASPLTGTYLVIKPGVLEAGRAYVFTATVTDTSVSGTNAATVRGPLPHRLRPS
jgi:hypothetical protein